jgi:hypothetical protein
MEVKMSKFVKSVGVAMLVAALTVVGLSALAYVQPAAAAETQAASAHGGGPGFYGQAGLEAAAEALGMTVDELTAQLSAGESLADLAEEAGVDLQDVRDAVAAANRAATQEAIEQAVTDGDITREHADWLLEGLEMGYWGGGSGFGPRGFGGFGGRGFGRPPFDSTVPPASNT